MWVSGVLGAVCFSLMSLVVSHLGTGISASEFLLGRSLVGLALLAPFVFFGSRKPVLLSPLLFGRGIIGTLAIIVLFIMIQNVGPATATAIHYTSPIYVFMLCVLFQGEQFSFTKMFALALVVGGVMMPVFDQTTALSLPFLLLGSLGALLSGTSFFMLKIMTGKISEISIYFIFCAVQLLTQFVLHFTVHSPDFHLRFGLIFTAAGLPCVLVGLLACAAQLLMNNSFKKLSGTTASLLNLLCIPFTALAEHFLFHREYDLSQLLMMVSIFSGILLLRPNKVFEPVLERSA